MAYFILVLVLFGCFAFLLGMRPGARDRPSLPLVLLVAFCTGLILLTSWILVAPDAIGLLCGVVTVVGNAILVPCWGYLIGRLVAERARRTRMRKLPTKTAIDEW